MLPSSHTALFLLLLTLASGCAVLESEEPAELSRAPESGEEVPPGGNEVGPALTAGPSQQPAPAQPVDPEPVDPEPVDPEPVDPEPADPEPVDPEPVDPEPVDPEPSETDAIILFSRTVDEMPLGPMTSDFIKAEWASHYSKGEERTAIVEVMPASAGRAVEVRYPVGGVGSTPSGATWESALGFDAEELYLSYWVRFDDDFDFRHGGKLPGFGGSEGHPHGAHDFTMRLMWREEGRIEFYLHGFEMPYETRTYWDDFGKHASFVSGVWHQIEMYLLLNTPGQTDGIMRGWLDGELACEELVQGSVRGPGADGTTINHVYFSTFFGGTSDPEYYAPLKEEVALFDEFLVAATRLGHPGPR